MPAVKSRAGILAIATALAAAAGVAWWRTNTADHSPKGEHVVNVQATQARVGPAPVEISAIGQVLSPHSVALRPQVSGTLAEVYFREGSDVKEGEPLFLIDPAPYQAGVAQARAQVARDEAALGAAQVNYDRSKELAAQHYITPQDLANAKAAAGQADATVQADRAALQRSEIDLAHTRVSAPISGRVGALAVRTGNLVGPSDAQPLLTINQLQPVHVEFAVPQGQLLEVQDALARGKVPVRVAADANGPVLGNGKLIFVDNAVDEATGTVKLRAEIDNSAQHLWPGAFVSVTATLAMQDHAVLLPEVAVQPGAAGSFVFLLDADKKVQLVNVRVDRQVGPDMVISEGLKGGETVVAHAPRNLVPGTTVNLIDAGPGATGPAAATTPAAAQQAAEPAPGKPSS
jgi:multidrug efflux system membrane fusion protein